MSQQRSFRLLVCTYANILICVAGAGIPFCAGASEASGRPFEVKDSIAMRKLVGYMDTFLFSPDRQSLVMVTKRGNLNKNTNEYELLLYKTTDVSNYLRASGNDVPPAPVVLARLSSTSNRPAISNPKWSADSSFVTFMGESPNELSQVYRVDVADKRLAKLTTAERGVFNYGASATNVVYSTTLEDSQSSLRTEPFVVTQEGLPALFGLSTLNPDEYGVYQTYIQHMDGSRRRVNEDPFRFIPTELRYWVSPDGRYAVSMRVPTRIPKNWEQYGETAPGRPIVATEDKNAVPGFIHQYVLIDLRDGSVKPLMDAPSAMAVGDFGTRAAFWSQDSRSVVVTSALLPVEGKSAVKGLAELRTPIVAEVEIASRNVTIVGRLPAPTRETRLRESRFYSWDAQDGTLTMRRNNRDATLPTLVFKKQAGAWQQSEVPAEAYSIGETDGRDLQIEIREGLNSPPKVYGIDLRTKRRKVLLDLNPGFGNLTLARAQVFEWADRKGTHWKGGLFLPPDSLSGHRLPLVIQTHGFFGSERFYVDGPSGTAFAAQALANKGFAVLQVEDRQEFVGRDEPARYMEAYESAIGILSQGGTIDPDRIGLIGFSRTCWHVKYAMTQSKYKFGAAVVSDGVDYGYFPFIASYNVLPGFDALAGFLQAYGELPVGQGLNAWHSAPAFNTDKVRTPLRIESIGKSGFLFEWEWYVLLKRLRKPVELTVIPLGTHVLVRPQDLLASQQGTVDWMQFWLKGEEDPDQSKAEQYKRWRELRKLQEKNEATRSDSHQ